MKKTNVKALGEIKYTDVQKINDYLEEALKLYADKVFKINDGVVFGLEVTQAGSGGISVATGAIHIDGLVGELESASGLVLSLPSSGSRTDTVVASYEEISDTPSTGFVLVDVTTRVEQIQTTLTRKFGAAKISILEGVNLNTVSSGYVPLATVTVDSTGIQSVANSAKIYSVASTAANIIDASGNGSQTLQASSIPTPGMLLALDQNGDLDLANGSVFATSGSFQELTVDVLNANTIVQGNTVDIGDAVLTLNAGATGAITPSADSGIEIQRGDNFPKASVMWREAEDKWEVVGGVLKTIGVESTGTITALSFNSLTGLSNIVGAGLGTAAVGTSTLAARADHVHPTTGIALLVGGNTFAGTNIFNVINAQSISATGAITGSSVNGITGLSSQIPEDSRNSGGVGVSTLAARADHFHSTTGLALTGSSNNFNATQFFRAGMEVSGNIKEGGVNLVDKYSPLGHTHNYLPTNGGKVTGNVGFQSADATPQAAITIGAGKTIGVELAAPTGLGTTTGASVGGVFPSGDHTYVVVAMDAAGNFGEVSSPVTRNIPTTTTNITISWNAVPGAVKYRLYKMASPDMSAGTIGYREITSTTFIENGTYINTWTGGTPILPTTITAFQTKIGSDGKITENGSLLENKYAYKAGSSTQDFAVKNLSAASGAITDLTVLNNIKEGGADLSSKYHTKGGSSSQDFAAAKIVAKNTPGAWGYVNANGGLAPSISANSVVTSVSRSATGSYTLTFDTPKSGNYFVVVSPEVINGVADNSSYSVVVSAFTQRKSSSSFQVRTSITNGGTTSADSGISFYFQVFFE